MLELAIDTLQNLFLWPTFGYLLLGVGLGLYFGIVPGLSGIVGMAIMLPFTFSMDPVAAFAFLMGMYAVTSSSDSIPSILIGIPGTAASQATVIDGYAMTRKGQASRALGAAFTVSAFGGLFGALGVAVSLPILKPLILTFASPEFFMLGLLGLTMVGSLSGNSLYKGLTAACIGVLIATVGYAEQVAIPRYWFDAIYLINGIPLEPLVLGLFAIPEIIEVARSRGSISKVAEDDSRAGLLTGITDVLRNWWLAVRSSAIGLYIGLLPGIGGSIVDWIAYGHAVQSAKDKSGFGQGDIRGVIAPEAANNAMKGGALIPTIAFGVPGTAPMAIMLGAFLIQGMTPGPQMLTTNLNVTLSLLWTLVIANILAVVVLLLFSRKIAKVVFLPSHYILPAIVVFLFMGSWISTSNIGDWYVLLGAGLLGYVMKQAAWPRPPVVLGFILCPIMENALHISFQSHGMSWILRPVSLAIALLVALTIFGALWRKRRNAPQAAGQASATEGNCETDRRFNALLIAFVVVALVYTTVQAMEWPAAVSIFPLVASITGLVLMALGIYTEYFGRNRGLGQRTPTGLLGKDFALLALLAGVIACTLLFGQVVAILAFVAVYLHFWGRCGIPTRLVYLVATWAVLYFMFGKVIAIVWHKPLFPLFS